MTFRSVFMLLLLVWLCIDSGMLSSQNLVPNGSFEEYEDCPVGLDQLSDCSHWSVSRGTPDFYHSCAIPSGGVSVPATVNGHQHALNGVGYAGFIQYRTPNLNAREHMMCELVQQLTVGTEYYFSMCLNRGTSIWLVKASNGQGAMLTTNGNYSLENPSEIEGPTFVNWEVLTDSTNWHQFKWSFVADSAYSHLVVGGFLLDAQLDTVSAEEPLPYGEAYYFVDEVRLSTDSSYAWESLHVEEEGFDAVHVYPNPTSGIMNVSGLQRTQTLTLWNTLGQKIKDMPFTVSKIYLSGLPNGVYFLEIVGTNERKTLRVLKQG